jgi:hypothetical protein
MGYRRFGVERGWAQWGFGALSASVLPASWHLQACPRECVEVVKVVVRQGLGEAPAFALGHAR